MESAGEEAACGIKKSAGIGKKSQKKERLRVRRQMKITFLGHSGFLVELEREYLLFDYFQGSIPQLAAEKPLYVFASHKHQDHFNPAIFKLAEKYPKVQYILSYDIKLKPWNLKKWGIGPETQEQAANIQDTKIKNTKIKDIKIKNITDQILSVRADTVYQAGDLEITTLKSTDEGVAFLVKAEGRTIYHAGDLNWWYWEEESKQWNNNMTADFKRQMNKLTGMSIDFAFLPLDPRQEQHYCLGFDYMLKTASVRNAFPMHMWGDFSVIKRWIQEGRMKKYDTNVIQIERDGQEWEFK